MHKTKHQPPFFNSFSHPTCCCVPPTLSLLLCCTPAHKAQAASAMQILHKSLLPSAPLPGGCCWTWTPKWCSKQRHSGLPWHKPWSPRSRRGRGCNACSPKWPTSSRTSTIVGGGVCNTNSFVPTHSKENISLFTLSKVTSDHSPPAKKLFLACFLPKSLAAQHLYLHSPNPFHFTLHPPASSNRFAAHQQITLCPPNADFSALLSSHHTLLSQRFPRGYSHL